ncbi:MAG: hypothetical protein ACLFN5_00395 [bacterium]
MVITLGDMKEKARQALPYFVSGWGEPGNNMEPRSAFEKDEAPEWVQKLEWEARSEIGAEWGDKHFYGLIAEILLDLIEYGEHDWDEPVLAPEEAVDEIASQFSIPTLNEELFEWIQEAPGWTDMVEELTDSDSYDVEQEQQIITEAMGNVIFNVRHAVLEFIYELLVEEADEG